MPRSDNFLPSCFLGCDTPYEDAKLVLFGAPYDGTVTFRPGSRFGPSAMRSDSIGLETYSPYQDADLTDCAICDIGDLDLPFGNRDKALAIIRNTAEGILRDGKIPLMVGGEHLVTLPALKAVKDGQDNLFVLHFDAHTDLREDYIGERLSHATVMRRVWEQVGDDRIFQFGIRSGEREEFRWAQEGHVCMNRFNLEGLPSALEKIGKSPLYVTIDLDVLDPSVFAGTGTPEPGGVSFKELLEAVCSLSRCNIVGADVVELSPHYDVSGVSTASACKILRELMLAILPAAK